METILKVKYEIIFIIGLKTIKILTNYFVSLLFYANTCHANSKLMHKLLSNCLTG